MILPFLFWLGLIACAPFLGQWWRSHYRKLALVFAAIPIIYYLLLLPPGASNTVYNTAWEYFSFIVLIGSLYVVSGGIEISVAGQSSPVRNVIFLALGGLLANVLGTTGASLLLIRPWLHFNAGRASARHVVFFIFIVANIGGGLTPIGDPPLLLGFLKGVPFWWVLRHCWAPWLLSMAWLLGVFYLLDRRGYAPVPAAPRPRVTCAGWRNIAFLAVIVAAVFVPQHLYLREGLMLMAASGAYLVAGKKVYDNNEFRIAPMFEMAALFFAIFATMMPALDWLQFNARDVLGTTLSPARIYWSAGGVSGILDSAPAYLAFAGALSGVFVHSVGGAAASLPEIAQTASAYLAALSVATVYFGALTYIGNGPNLMVKLIAERRGLRLPGFLAYFLKWAVPILLPLLLVLRLVFFH
jgi:Na+/H+ antiporter NhaD/arsenite permease-like protein